MIRHHAVDDPGFIAAAFTALGAQVTVRQFPADGPLPALDGVAHVVVLGAAWSLYDEHTVGGWIGAELDLLREADRRGIPVLGICFGAQALAAAHGGRVTPAPRPEIGWYEVESLAPDIIEPGPWLEFHQDQCLPPAQARVLARTGVCVQAFALRASLAVQFHPEVDGAQLKRWLDDVGGTAAAEAAGTDPASFLAATIAEEPAAAARADRLVRAAVRLAAEARSRLLAGAR